MVAWLRDGTYRVPSLVQLRASPQNETRNGRRPSARLGEGIAGSLRAGETLHSNERVVASGADISRGVRKAGVNLMTLYNDFVRNITRRHFFRLGSHAVGWAALTALLDADRAHAANLTGNGAVQPHHPAKAKQVIYLHMVGGPPQMDLFDYKPQMNEWYDKDLPESIRNGQRLTTMTSGQARFPVAPSKFKFAQHGKCGMWVSELLPNFSQVVDDVCFIRSMNTEAINHEP